jgi:LmbE family N-acetylglucosaminyl deacetylase
MDATAQPPLIRGDGTPEAVWLAAPALNALRSVLLDDLLRVSSRLVVIAPHPDDEVLGSGGLMNAAARAEREVVVLSVTDGEASHPQKDRNTLRLQRAGERDRAFGELGLLSHQARRMALPDGALHAHQERLVDLIVQMTKATDLVLAPWVGDGHPDHDACSDAARRAQRAVGFELLEYPVWGWHWCAPDQFPFKSAFKFQLDATAHDAKRRAITMFHSQIEAFEQPAILSPGTLERFRRPFEVFLR